MNLNRNPVKSESYDLTPLHKTNTSGYVFQLWFH